MTVEQQIAKLESLLGRIRRNAGQARTAHAPVAPATSTVPVREEAPHSALPPTTRADAAKVAVAPAPVVAPAPSAPSAPVVELSSAPTSEVEELEMGEAELEELGEDSIVAEELGEEAQLEVVAEAEELEIVSEVVASPAGGPADLDFELTEPPEDVVPESRPRAAAQPTAAALELEPPIKTPPPESGRQYVASVPPPPPADEEDELGVEAELKGASGVDDLLEADLTATAISRAPVAGGPTMEQLGDVVELEGADAPTATLELGVAVAAPTPAPVDELEMELPKPPAAGVFHAGIVAPSTAAADLARHRAGTPPPKPVTAAPVAPAAGPAVFTRPAIEAPHAADIVAAKPAKVPDTFVELLDASLSLRA